MAARRSRPLLQTCWRGFAPPTSSARPEPVLRREIVLVASDGAGGRQRSWSVLYLAGWQSV